MRQLVYTMFVANHNASFHFWWKENLVKYQKVSKYYAHGCLQNFLLLFFFLWTALLVKNSHFFYFIFLRNVLAQTLALFCNLVVLILSCNCVNSLRVKIVQKNKFEGAWGELEAKDCFLRQSWTKYMRQTLVFMWNSAIVGNFNFYFSADFC